MVTAVLMLDAGARRKTVMEAMDFLCCRRDGRQRPIPSIPLYQAYTCSQITRIEIGDGINVRIAGIAKDKNHPGWNVWIQIETGAEMHGYDPLLTIAINVNKLRRCLKL